MKFLCAESVFDGGDPKVVNKKGKIIQKSYRRDETYDMDEAEVKHLFAMLTGLSYEYDARTHLPIPETEQIVTGFLDCFRSADDFARDYIEKHNDDLLDIVEAKVQYLRDHPPVIGTAEPTKLRLHARSGKPVEGEPTPEAPKVGEKQELRPRAIGRPPMSAEARAAAGARLKAAREKKRAEAKAAGQ